MRKLDKLSYLIGTNYAVLFSYMIAKWPDDYIYVYATVAQALLMLHRYVTFWQNGWHMFLVDFCYFANLIVFLYLMAFPTSDWLLVTSFVFGNGTLAAGVMAFRNSFVPHKIEYMTSLATHAVPLILTHHVRWWTIPDQAALPIA